MKVDKVILYLISIFFVIGGIDYIFGSPLKIGGKFEEGIKTMGALAIGMIGIYSLVPIFSKFLCKVIWPISKIFNLDPSVIISTFLAVDMGGYNLSNNLSLNSDIGVFSGIIIASSLGATISFSIPVALGMISKEDQKYFSKGVMIGIVSIPIGCLIAGIYQNISWKMLIVNLIPIFIFAIFLGIGLMKSPNILISFFNIFGKGIMGISIIGLLLQGIKTILGINIIVGLAPLSESAVIVSKIAFVLGGAYPMLELINRIFKNSFKKIGNSLGINVPSVGGLIGNLASNLLVFANYKDMNSSGKVICAAFAVSGAFVFGGQLGFVAGVEPKMISAFIISKFSAGTISILLAVWMCKRESNIKNY